MHTRPWAPLLLFLAATACATQGARPLKLDASDTGSRIALVAQHSPLQVTRSPVRRQPVEVSKAEYHAAMLHLARLLRDKLPPRPSSHVILPFQGTRQSAEPIPNLGKNRAGQTVSDGKTSLRFDKDGFPEFDTKFEILLENIHIGSGDRAAHIKAANHNLYQAISRNPTLSQTLGLSRADVGNLLSKIRAPPGYRWHHHQDAGRMQLVTIQEHDLANPHTGGMAIWGGGYTR